jgi:hypothetical protein
MGDPKAQQNELDAPHGRRTLAAILLLGGVGTILYWTTFFTSGVVQATGEPCYLVFERAFPAADACTAVAAILAGVGLWRRQPSAVLFGIACGSGFVFLGLMDVLYNLEQGMYALRTPEMAYEIVINIFCLTVGPAAIAYAWRQRRVLDPR